MTNNIQNHIGKTITIRLGVSRGENTYGYRTCSLRNHLGKKIAACNGGGYDLIGTAIGDWIARTFPQELCSLKVIPEVPSYRKVERGVIEQSGFYGLTFHDPNYKTPEHVVQDEKAGNSLGLERYQEFYKASSKVPTKTHTVPIIDGACGTDSVLNILRAIGLSLNKVSSVGNVDVYIIEEAK